MLRPFYRSRLFWLGLPGLAFLLWGWLADPMVGRRVRGTLGEYCLSVSDRSRVVEIDWEVYGSGRLMAPGIHAYTYRLGPRIAPTGEIFPADEKEARDRQWLPPAFRYEVWENDYHLGKRRVPEVKVAYWFLLLLYLATWGALLVGWQRRKTRLMKLYVLPKPGRDP